jgi:hypothetical protein
MAKISNKDQSGVINESKLVLNLILCLILSSILKDSKYRTDFEFGLYSESPPIPGVLKKLEGYESKVERIQSSGAGQGSFEFIWQ